MNPFKDLTKQGLRHKNLCHLKRHISGMAHNLGFDFDQLFPHRPQ